MHPYRLDMNNSSSWNATPGYVATLIPNGGLHEAYKTWLNRIVIALLTLKNTRQEPIPFIFRPYHEMDGSWFWWGSTACTDEEYKQLFRFTIEYMRAQGLNNMLVCYAPSMYQNKMQYLKRYPGDDVVDILGVDAYYKSANPNSNNGDANWTNIINKLKIVSDLAIEKNKVAALTETGQQNITSADYFSRLNTQINQAGVQISYLMFWCNYAATVDAGGGAGFYVPYNSWNQTASKQNFVQFCNQPNVLTATTMPNIYQ
jgi:mannan endo-1,4-beta-mannosidase